MSDISPQHAITEELSLQGTAPVRTWAARRPARKAAAVFVHILGCCIRGESLHWKPQDRFLAMEVRTNANKIEGSPGGAEICANRMSPVQCLVIVGSLPSMRSTQAEFECGV